jgi:hypothetical protein
MGYPLNVAHYPCIRTKNQRRNFSSDEIRRYRSLTVLSRVGVLLLITDRSLVSPAQPLAPSSCLSQFFLRRSRRLIPSAEKDSGT